MKSSDIQIDKDELKKEREKNFRERLRFVSYWVNYIKNHPDKEWSKQQNIVIDSQLKSLEKFGKKNSKNKKKKSKN